MGVPFAPEGQIRQISATDQVCDKIKQCIREGVWEVGTRLPAESALAVRFGVNRLTVRMALQKLNTLGVLETRNGSGTYVMEFDFGNLINETAEFYMEPELLENVSEFRKTVELECARLAIQRATPEEFDKLEHLLNEYQKVTETIPTSLKEYQAVAEADLNFHRQICEMSHNKLYLYAFLVAQHSIYQYVLILNRQRYEQSRDIPPEHRPAPKDTHRQIFQALKDRDFETCQKYYLEMVDHNAEW